jgi:hypothetical protein
MFESVRTRDLRLLAANLARVRVPGARVPERVVDAGRDGGDEVRGLVGLPTGPKARGVECA